MISLTEYEVGYLHFILFLFTILALASWFVNMAGDGRIGCKGRVAKDQRCSYLSISYGFAFLFFCRLLAYCLRVGMGFIFLFIPLGFCTYTPFHPSRCSFAMGWVVFFPNGRKNLEKLWIGRSVGDIPRVMNILTL